MGKRDGEVKQKGGTQEAQGTRMPIMPIALYKVLQTPSLLRKV